MNFAVNNIFHLNSNKIVLSIALSMALYFNTDVFSTPLPSEYPLLKQEFKTEIIDVGLGEWFESYSDNYSLNDLDQEQYQFKVDKGDLLTKAYLRLNQPQKSKQNLKLLLKFPEILYLINSDPIVVGTHPLYPYALEGLINLQKQLKMSEEADTSIIKMKNLSPSCSSTRIMSKYWQEKGGDLSRQEKVEALQLVKNLVGRKLRRQALTVLISQLKENEDPAVKEAFAVVSSDFSDLKRRLPWVKNLQPDQEVIRDLKKELLLLRIEKNDCSEAKSFFKSNWALFAEDFDEMMLLARKTSKCGKIRKFEDRIAFWDELKAIFETKEEEKIWGWADIEKSIAYWQVDDVEQATSLLKQVALQSQTKKYLPQQAAAQFYLGSILESKSDFTGALPVFLDYISKFPGQKNYVEVLRKISMIYAESEQWLAMLQPLNLLLKNQDELPADLRLEDDLGFTLFWLGRATLAIEGKDKAIIYFERLSKELYSTFYGAMGHYILEEISATKFALEPSRTANFDLPRLLSSVPHADRIYFRRAESLLEFGNTADAFCEVEQLGEAAQGNEPKSLLKSLIYNAGGKWLTAVKEFTKLPRSYRSNLPVGFERIIFPLRYQEFVEKYAQSSFVDPYLIYALIRQESVFNANAKSPAGALGVMQLMPNTAIQQSKKIGIKNVSSENRGLVRHLQKDPNVLFDPEFNISLGVHYLRQLLDIYQEPVYVLASYNAGEGRVRKWVKSYAQFDMMTFIERIPFQETRSYVKLVLRNYFYYKRLYEGRDINFPHLGFVTKAVIAEQQKAADALKN